MTEQLRMQIERWHERDEHQKIVDAIQAIPQQVWGYEEIGLFARAYNNLGEPEKALELLLAVAEQGKDDFRWHYRTGYSYYYLDRDQEAADAFERAVALKPDDPHCWMFLAMASRALGDRERFEWAKEQLRALDPALFEEQFPPNSPNSYLPEVYSPEQLQAVETHIRNHFGDCAWVYHEKISPDIHVDLCIIQPTPGRDYYTLVTVGMGAHRMRLPEELHGRGLDRAELVLCLPPSWNIRGRADKWFWPLRWLKILARLPVSQDTWLGWGHTVPKGEPFSYNTCLSSMLLTEAALFPPEASACPLPDGDAVHFYQVVPIYQDELDCKLQQGAQTLIDRLGRDAYVVEIDRPSVCANGMPEPVLSPPSRGWTGPQGCLATRRLTQEGCAVGYLYREKPIDPADSGWRFLEGNEDPDYMQNPQNTEVCRLERICGADPPLFRLLDAPCGTAFFRGEDGRFYEELMED